MEMPDLSGIKMIVTDMDGTLLNSKHELSPAFFPIFEKLKAKGIIFVAASGRQYSNILNRFTEIRDDIYIIAENGSYVVYRDEDILVQAMDLEMTRQQLYIAKRIPDVFPILCGKKTAYIDNTTPAFVDNVNMYYDRVEVVEDLLQVHNDEFLKIALCDLKGAEQNSFPLFRDKLDILQVKVSGKIWLDLSHRLANKGRAIRVLQEKLGISRQETMAFGDYLNDVEMMTEAVYSYAMENAHEEVKKVSRYRARSNDEHGVIEILQHVIHSF